MDRIDRRRKEHQNCKRRFPCANTIPMRRTARSPVSVSDENPKTAWAPKSVLTADEHGSYDDRVGLAILRRVKHSLAHPRGR